jgi:hypothetical protein
MLENFGNEVLTPKQGKEFVPTCVLKHLICELQPKGYCTDTSGSSALMCGQGLLVIGRPACFATSAYRQSLPRFPLTHIGQSYWKLYHWQSEQDMVLRHILAVLCEIFDGQVEGDPLHGFHARQI